MYAFVALFSNKMGTTEVCTAHMGIQLRTNKMGPGRSIDTDDMEMSFYDVSWILNSL